MPLPPEGTSHAILLVERYGANWIHRANLYWNYKGQTIIFLPRGSMFHKHAQNSLINNADNIFQNPCPCEYF